MMMQMLVAGGIAPYTDGLRFVHALRRRGGWAAVDEAWKHPPTTTEQLLHVDKYLAHEPAESIDLPQPPPGAAYRSVYEDVLGEQGVRMAWEQWLPRSAAAVAASGWAGDRAVLYRASTTSEEVGQYALAWRVRFDSGSRSNPGALAQRAFRSLYLGLHSGEPGGHTSFCQDRPGLGPLVIARSSRDLVMVTGIYERRGEKVAARADCAQTSSWAAEILATGER